MLSTGDANVVEIIVREEAPIADKTLKETNEEGLVPSDVLVVRINRGEKAIMPTGATTIEEGDFVTIHSRSGVTEETLEVSLERKIQTLLSSCNGLFVVLSIVL